MSELTQERKLISGQDVTDLVRRMWELKQARSELNKQSEESDSQLSSLIGQVAVLGEVFDFTKLPADAKELAQQRAILLAQKIFLDEQIELAAAHAHNQLTAALLPKTDSKPLLHFKVRNPESQAIFNVRANSRSDWYPPEISGTFGHINDSGGITLGDHNHTDAQIMLFDWTDGGFVQEVDVDVIYPEDSA